MQLTSSCMVAPSLYLVNISSTTGKGKGIWSGRKTGLWLRGVEPQAQDWFHQQTGRIWKLPVPRPTPDFGTKCPELMETLTKKQMDFSLKIEMGGKPF